MTLARRLRIGVVLAATVVGIRGPRAAAQDIRARMSGQAVVAGLVVDPTAGGREAGQFVVEDPVLMFQAGAFHDRLRLHLTADFEGWTMPNGVITIGAWGEGFNDKRHPHTYVHEAMVEGIHHFGSGASPVTVSLSLGKGFVAFGSDDPMNRPALAFPINHHLSQILERAVAIAGVRAGPLVMEGSLFNGDEPEHPGQWPRIGHRFGDSWAFRATLEVATGFAFEGSYAEVSSPEHRPGAATDQAKWHAAARWEGRLGPGGLVLFGEWARTSEAAGFFVFRSELGEAQWTRGRHRLYYRLERTERPEEERTADPFRSRRPHLENSILGVTRWVVQVLGYGRRIPLRRLPLSIEPITELSVATVASVGGGLFDVKDFYGRTTIWGATVALRLSAGTPHRMGRYGVWGHSHPARDQ